MRGLRGRVIALGCILALFAAASVSIDRPAAEGGRGFDMSVFPETIGGWSSREIPVERGTLEILETDTVIVREYRDGSGIRIGLALVYYPSPERIALHLPESCLLGQGSRLSGRESTRIRRGSQGEIPCVRLVTESGAGRSYVLYYFQAGGYHTGSYLGFRLTLLKRQFAGKCEGAALVRFSAAAEPGVAEERCVRALEDFAACASLALDRCMP